ncbi:MAG: hypothetical protein ACI4OR_01490 [Alphaproteobacteria bacterium]
MKKTMPLKCTPLERKIVLKLTRQGFYFTVLLALILGLWGISDSYKTDTFTEHGLVENMQLFTLILSTLIFLATAIKNTFYRPVLFLLASLTTFCCIRELDSLFEKWIPVISWKFAFVFPAVALFYAFKKRSHFKKPLLRFLDSTAFDLMFTAMIIFIPLAQCIGHRSFIEDAIGHSSHLSHIRRLIEESMELVAYVLIFLSAVEMFLGLIKKEEPL